MESKLSIPQNWKVQIILFSLKYQRCFVQSKHRNQQFETINFRSQRPIGKIRSEGVQIAS